MQRNFRDSQQCAGVSWLTESRLTLPRCGYPLFLFTRAKEADIAQNAQERTPAAVNGRQLATILAKVAADTRCTNVVVLDVSGFSPITDYLVIATGTSPRQMRTVADDCAEAAEQASYSSLSATGYEGNSWICVDFIDVILHIFSAEARAFYDLDNLWADATKLDWDGPKTQHKAPAEE